MADGVDPAVQGVQAAAREAPLDLPPGQPRIEEEHPGDQPATVRRQPGDQVVNVTTDPASCAIVTFATVTVVNVTITVSRSRRGTLGTHPATVARGPPPAAERSRVVTDSTLTSRS